MADKEGEAVAVRRDADKELAAPPPLSNDDFILPLLILTILHGVFLSLAAILLNSMSPQLWAPSPIMKQIVTSFTSQLNTHIDVELFASHPLYLPVALYCIPLLINLSMNVLLFTLLKPHRANAAQPTQITWIPALCMMLTVGFGFVMGFSFWEELLVILPLTMSFFVLPLYFGLRRKRMFGATPEKD